MGVGLGGGPATREGLFPRPGHNLDVREQGCATVPGVHGHHRHDNRPVEPRLPPGNGDLQLELLLGDNRVRAPFQARRAGPGRATPAGGKVEAAPQAREAAPEEAPKPHHREAAAAEATKAAQAAAGRERPCLCGLRLRVGREHPHRRVKPRGAGPLGEGMEGERRPLRAARGHADPAANPRQLAGPHRNAGGLKRKLCARRRVHGRHAGVARKCARATPPDQRRGGQVPLQVEIEESSEVAREPPPPGEIDDLHVVCAGHDGHHLGVLHPVVDNAFDEHGRGDHVQGAPSKEHGRL